MEQEPRKGQWLRMSDLSEQEDDRYKCSRCGNIIHHKNKMDLYTFNSWCGRCGSDNGRHIKVDDDCVSRKFMYELGATCIATRDKNDKLIALGAIEELPPVTPTMSLPCEDAVSRQVVYETIDDCNSDGLKGIFCSYDDGERFKEYIKALPPVTPIHKDRTVQDFVDKCRECGKQKKGKWIFTKTIFDRHGCTVECSSCHKKWKTYEEIRWKKENKYCPNCGTKMEVEE